MPKHTMPSPEPQSRKNGAYPHLVSVAPMMDWTDRHCRYFLRLISGHTLLYTEMITTAAILHGDHDRLLSFNSSEHPVALQLGGSNPQALATCASIGEDFGYDEINLNVGCPSNRVQSGRFGACLMAEPELVAECISSMNQLVQIPVTVKSRIGIDDLDTYEDLYRFIHTVADAGCTTFIIHARKAWLQGLSPKENREIPPLCYDRVYQVKRDFPHLNIIINGGIKSTNEIQQHLTQVDGVMIGREAYHNPYLLAEVDTTFYGDTHAQAGRKEIIEKLLPYISQQIEHGVSLNSITRHLLGLFHGAPGARAWRRYISEHAHLPGAGIEVIQQASNLISD
jgi:tRNA-dihydrouridine synthase A